MVKIVDDPIVMRRLVNQHNIECYVEGKSSEYCNKDITYCWIMKKPYETRRVICDRCYHRDSMTNHSESAFIGFIPQILYYKRG